MSSPREKVITTNIRSALTQMGAKIIKIHGSAMQEAGTPDLLGCYMGRTLAIEVKVPGKEAEPIQAVRLQEWRRAGAIAGVAHSVEEAMDLLRRG